jgi:hypothetical protein
MKTKTVISLLGLAVIGLVIVMLAWKVAVSSAAFSPPPEAQGYGFSVSIRDPLTEGGPLPSDALGIGGQPLLACENLGLACLDANTGALDEVNGLSTGMDFTRPDLPPFQFSVAAGSLGLADTAVSGEASCTPAEAQADVFESSLREANYQDLDGNGVACGDNNGFGLGLSEGDPTDHLDALVENPCQSVDLNCDGLAEAPLFLTLAAGSPTLALLNAGPADILMTGVQALPQVWAAGQADLGLQVGDVIDALCLYENGSGVFDAPDRLLFSLAPGSPTLADLAASPADVLVGAPARVAYPARMFGLLASDDIDALLCGKEASYWDLFMPMIRRR